jgi:hypothetical protein
MELLPGDKANVARYSADIDADFVQAVNVILSKSLHLETIPFGVLHVVNRELSIRSRHKLKNVRVFIDCSATGFTYLFGSLSPHLLMPASDLTTCVSLDPAPQQFNPADYPLASGYMRGKFTRAQWANVALITGPLFTYYRDDPTQLPTTILLA